jgi:hypothetical protein
VSRKDWLESRRWLITAAREVSRDGLDAPWKVVAGQADLATSRFIGISGETT